MPLRTLLRWLLPSPARLPKRLHLFCVGTAKSGTHSVAEIFEKAYRCGHEVEVLPTIDLIRRLQQGQATLDEARDFLLAREGRTNLEVDSSHPNYYFSGLLAEMFPEARFVLTLRDCLTWTDSFINHQLNHSPQPPWKIYRDLRFGVGRYQHPPEERLLAERGLYTLDGYFSYWNDHNSTVITQVPAARLLVLPTHELTARISELPAFLGLPAGVIDTSRVHGFPARQKHGLLAQIDPEYVEQKLQAHAAALMQRFFPGVTVRTAFSSEQTA